MYLVQKLYISPHGKRNMVAAKKCMAWQSATSSLKFLVLGNKSTYQIIRVSLASSYALHLVIELLEWLS